MKMLNSEPKGKPYFSRFSCWTLDGELHKHLPGS